MNMNFYKQRGLSSRNFLVQVDLRIQGLMVVKLPANFRRDTECQDLSMLMINCECSLLPLFGYVHTEQDKFENAPFFLSG